jgi:Domain of unknown function (DUF4249)
MKRTKNIALITVATLIFMSACKQAYQPSIAAANSNYMVVEGVINTGPDSTIIKLSRTVNLSGKTSSNPELNAQVTVENDQNASYPLQEIGNGKYGSPPLNLDNTRKYRLRIITSNAKEYVSDLESSKINPPIDSIGYVAQGNNLQIYVNTHDPNNNTRYYRWSYQETWQFHAKYFSMYITNGSTIVQRDPSQQIYSCFAGSTSGTIILGSSAKLQQDVIYQDALTQIASSSEKIETKYSILVKQYALTADEFAFWQNLKKNTEQLGSIFDAQPSNLNGNVHSITNPSEQVIGYVGVTNVQQKRVFITHDKLPLTWGTTYPYDCQEDSSLYCRITPPSTTCRDEVQANLIPLDAVAIPLAAIYKPNSLTVIGYTSTAVDCADCTLRGVTKAPDFWK